MRQIQSQIALPTIWGSFSAEEIMDGSDTHLLLKFGDIRPDRPVLVRMHSSCCFGDVFGGLSCDCRAQLEQALLSITSEGSGLIFYLQQEGRGLGLRNKIEAIRVEQSLGFDTVEAFSLLKLPLDLRRYEIVSKILLNKGIRSIRLLTNNPDKCSALIDSGIEVIRESLITPPHPDSIDYIRAKINKMGHIWNHSLESPE